jgi:hypothetical protein
VRVGDGRGDELGERREAVLDAPRQLRLVGRTDEHRVT